MIRIVIAYLVKGNIAVQFLIKSDRYPTNQYRQYIVFITQLMELQGFQRPGVFMLLMYINFGTGISLFFFPR